MAELQLPKLLTWVRFPSPAPSNPLRPPAAVQLGNNLFGVNPPPVCYTCTLNGYDASTYDLPGAFWYFRGTYKF